LAGALLAGLRDDRAVALAGRAGGGGHDVAEERARDALDRALPLARRAGHRGGAGAAAGALAHAAQDGRLHGELPRGAADGVHEIDVEHDLGVTAALGPRDGPAHAAGRAAEERGKDVGEVAEARAGRAAAGSAATQGVLTAGVVEPALLLVAQHVVG